MGNQLAGIAPAQIYPVEYYFVGQFGAEIKFEASMGSTRFFKVAKAKSEEGHIVVKVFVKHDTSLPLEEYKDHIEQTKKSLANASNCLPFQRIEIAERAAYLMRQYVKHSLYDRVSTRPFLTTLEKKWITFQILCALNQCHKQKICHGDIKLENILITSWNWILLSDFASFKPTHLPVDNPADFTYFFDTSRRRTCYIAPERFVELSAPKTVGENERNQDDTFLRLVPSPTKLSPNMDIFSAGCALLELWTEGSAPFELSQLLSYKAGDRQLVEKHLQSINNEQLQNLISSMIDLDPAKRKSAETYLAEERDRLFPEYFYSFLQSYLQIFSTMPIKTADEKIICFQTDIDHCIRALKYRPGVDSESKATTCLAEEDGLILIVTLVTSCIRSLRQTNTKIAALEILQKLSSEANSEVILDRILPYILCLAKSASPKVQVFALESLTACLDMVKDLPRSDSNIFPEYILPEIVELAYDSNAVIVRIAFAKNIANLATTAIRFLDETQRNAPKEMPIGRYETELNALHNIIGPALLALLTDNKAEVKQALLESNICDLCAFFGKDKANDYILMHVLTYLNSENKHLRASFFDNISVVVGYIGTHVEEKFLPLIQKGFFDLEEFVIVKAIRAASILVELGHFRNDTISEMLKETACYLCHPNVWIRHEICGLILASARVMRAIDIQCRIVRAIRPFLKEPIIQARRYEILMDKLVEPIPRRIFDIVLKFPHLDLFLKTLKERAEKRKNNEADFKMQYREMDKSLIKLFQRLQSEGLNVTIELQLLAMRRHLEARMDIGKPKPSEGTEFNGRVLTYRKNVCCFEYPLQTHLVKCPPESRQIDGFSTKNASPAIDVVTASIASGGLAATPAEATLQHSPSGSSLNTAFSLGEYAVPELNGWKEYVPQYRRELDNLCAQVRRGHNMLVLSQQLSYENFVVSYSSSWRLKGTMIANVHEHSDSVIRLCPLRAHSPLFASGSRDETIRIWDCSKMSGYNGVNKSRQMYKAKMPIAAIAACEGGQSLVVGGNDGHLLLLRVDRNSSKMSLQHARHIHDNEKTGPVVDMHSYEQLLPSVVIYATLYGSIIAWDTRMHNNAWQLQCETQKGTISSICADPTGSWLAAGTSHGNHIVWDLRFQLPIAEIVHPDKSWIRKIVCHPTEPSRLISATKSINEISVWNIESGSREMSIRFGNNSWTNAILGGTVDGQPVILTGSTDQRLRYVDLCDPKKSSVVVPAVCDNLENQTFSYKENIVGSTSEFYENLESSGKKLTLNDLERSDTSRNVPHRPSKSHHDAITDLLMCKDKGQINIVSASRDGVIKVWR